MAPRRDSFLFLFLFLGFSDWAAAPAQSLAEAAREAAQKAAAGAPRGEAVTLRAQNVSTLEAGEFAEARRALEAELRARGWRLVEGSAASTEIRATLSESWTRYLWVVEVRRGDERRVAFASAPRPLGPPVQPRATLAIDKQLLWEQAEQILDVAVLSSGSQAAGLLVLDPAKVALYRRGSAGWQLQQSFPIAGAAWPRDPRGRLLLETDSYSALLPGLLCRGSAQPALQMECRPSQEPWPLEAGPRRAGRAKFSAGRNLFEGTVQTEAGITKNLLPFFSSAVVDERGQWLWIFAGADGRARLYDQALEPAGTLGDCGSDLVSVQTQCGRNWQVLITKSGDAGEPDAVQAYEIVDRQAVAASQPVDFAGPITALWPAAGGSSAVAVSRDLKTGRYAAFSLAISCPR